MDLENRTNVPKPLYDVFNSWFNGHPKMKPFEFSATELLKSSKQILLRRNHEDEVRKDVQLCMKAIMGTWMHYAMSNALEGREGCIVERRFSRPVTVSTGGVDLECTVSGGVDLLYRDENGLHIIDYKNTNQAKIDKASEGNDTSFLDQMYTYAWLIEYETGERPVDATIVALNTLLRSGEIDLDDPSKRPIQMLTFDLDDMDYHNALVERMHNRMAEVLTGKLSDCTDEDMWLSEKKYGVKKPDSKRFNKVCATREEADGFIISKGWVGKGYEVTEIMPEPKKCRLYCDYLPWCEQGRLAVEKYEKENADE